MQMTKKAKILTASLSGMIALAIVVSLLFINQGNPLPKANPDNLDNPPNLSGELGIIDPSTQDITDDITSEQNGTGATGKESITLDVGGSPKPGTSDLANVNVFIETPKGILSELSGSNPTNQPIPTSTKQKPPSVGVTIVPDKPLPKTTTPTPANPEDKTDASGWTPPPPGAGTGQLIWEGAQNIKIDISTSVETLQRDLGYLVGSKLLDAGYNTLYPNASPGEMVENANRNYARTGVITLTPASYGLTKVVGYYNVKLPATGTNIVEAGNIIFDYMKSDPVFNDKVKTVFSTPKDGWLSVYQKDGYFYILYVAIDIGYSSFG